ncbi:MAG: hypothetical protein ACI37Q_00430 [Candidatus Gastranaerophilaceae bacterium]
MKKLLLLVVVSMAVQIQSYAAISVDQTTHPAVLQNNGYSAQTTDMINVSKARAQGAPYYSADEVDYKNQNKFVRFWRKLYVYTDPAAEDYSFYHHDTNTVPAYTDL